MRTTVDRFRGQGRLDNYLEDVITSVFKNVYIRIWVRKYNAYCDQIKINYKHISICRIPYCFEISRCLLVVFVRFRFKRLKSREFSHSFDIILTRRSKAPLGVVSMRIIERHIRRHYRFLWRGGKSIKYFVLFFFLKFSVCPNFFFPRTIVFFFMETANSNKKNVFVFFFLHSYLPIIIGDTTALYLPYV